MQLKNFQLSAVKSLFEAMDKPTRDIIPLSLIHIYHRNTLVYQEYLQLLPHTNYMERRAVYCIFCRYCSSIP